MKVVQHVDEGPGTCWQQVRGSIAGGFIGSGQGIPTLRASPKPLKPAFLLRVKGMIGQRAQREKTMMRQYRILSRESVDRPGRSQLRRNVRARLIRLEDGHELEVSMKALGQVGDIVSLEDEHVSLGLWKPPRH
jgi:hypothetical protein